MQVVVAIRSRQHTLAAETWRLLLDYFMANRDRHVALASQFGLTIGDMKALLSLDPDQPRPMRVLAEGWRCDASNVTWLIDRLEERGLAERRGLLGDRRIKTVALTPLGEKTRSDVLQRMYEPPDDLAAMSRADLQALHEALRKLPKSVC